MSPFVYPHKFVIINQEGTVVMTADTNEAPELLDKIKAAIRPYLP